MTRTSDAASLARLIETQGPCTAPLDAAAEYIRVRIDRVLPMYTLAMAPQAVVVFWLINAIAGERRSLIPQYSLYLVLATLWRWIWLAKLQQQVQQDLRAGQRVRFWSRIGAIILVRLYANLAITWGSLLLGVPAFYGLFVGSFAAPMMLEDSSPAHLRVRQTLSWVQHSGKRLMRVLTVMSAIAVLLLIAIFASQIMLAETVLPSLLGINTTDLNVTLDSWSWRLGILYFVFLLIDLFWTVASVTLYYDTQSRRMATDLRARMVILAEASA